LQRNLKLYFQYILFGVSHLYLDRSARDQKDVLVVVPKNVLYFTVLHVRLSSLFSTSQLVDIFAYELPVLLDSKIQTLTSSNAILVYNFHNLTFHERFFFFVLILLLLRVMRLLTQFASFILMRDGWNGRFQSCTAIALVIKRIFEI